MRFELFDLPGLFAALPAELSALPELWLDPDFELEDDASAEELAELPPVPDELDEEERTAALGGGATGSEKRGSRATRIHSFRPNAL